MKETLPDYQPANLDSKIFKTFLDLLWKNHLVSDYSGLRCSKLVQAPPSLKAEEILEQYLGITSKTDLSFFERRCSWLPATLGLMQVLAIGGGSWGKISANRNAWQEVFP